jgi:GR25 family glycosyltransferase involved in LPS biosynthesis
MNLDKIYLINLEQSTDRLEHFKNEVKRCNLPEDKIHIFKAIDGNSHIFTPDEEQLLEKMDNKSDLDNNRIKACFLSHYYVLKDIEKNGYGKCLVLEDDVRFVSDIKRRLNELTTNLDEIEKWYIVYIGLHSVAAGSYFEDFPIEGSYDSSFFCKKKITDYIGVFNDGFNPCALSYLVNGNNVDQIIEKMTIHPRAADYCYNNILIGLDAFYCALHVLATGNSNLDTTIHRAYNHTDSAYKYKDILSSYKRINHEED